MNTLDNLVQDSKVRIARILKAKTKGMKDTILVLSLLKAEVNLLRVYSTDEEFKEYIDFINERYHGKHNCVIEFEKLK